MPLVLAFDIERSGSTKDFDTIAIGASVVGSNLQELDSFFVSGYIRGETVFEERCLNEFWKGKEEILKQLEYTGSLTKHEREAEMIKEFQRFRLKWETIASEQKLKIELVSDNNVYDGGFINDLIMTYKPENNGLPNLPIPFSVLDRSYKPFFETFSQQRGLLMSVDPEFILKNDWGYTKRILELYDVPKPMRVADHHPLNDAYTVAYDQQVLFGIASGKFKRCYTALSPT